MNLLDIQSYDKNTIFHILSPIAQGTSTIPIYIQYKLCLYFDIEHVEISNDLYLPKTSLARRLQAASDSIERIQRSIHNGKSIVLSTDSSRMFNPTTIYNLMAVNNNYSYVKIVLAPFVDEGVLEEYTNIFERIKDDYVVEVEHDWWDSYIEQKNIGQSYKFHAKNSWLHYLK